MASDLCSKKPKKMIKIGTHDGTFHCDEVLACFMLRRLPEYKDADILRTRDPMKLSECDVVVDVGGIYDSATHRYDHHQRTFNESMNSLVPSRPWVTRLSSAGLIYHHFGHRVISEMAQCPVEDPVVEILFNKVYENFVEEVDGVDNGVDQCPEKPRYAVTTTLGSRVRFLQPAWNEPEKHTRENMDKLFATAMDLVGAEFSDRIHSYLKIWLPARKLVEAALDSRFEVDPSGEVLSLGCGGCPWKDHLMDLELEKKVEPLIKYVLFQDSNAGTWRIQCVPATKNSFENRLSLPEAWRGVRDEELSKVTGIPGSTFVHAGGFIGGGKTYDSVLEMARAALKIAKD